MITYDPTTDTALLTLAPRSKVGRKRTCPGGVTQFITMMGKITHIEITEASKNLAGQGWKNWAR